MEATPFVDLAGPPPAPRRANAAPDPGPSLGGPLAVVRAYLAGRLEPEAIAPEAALEAPGLPGNARGAAAIAGYWAALLGAVDGHELTVETAFEAGDRAAVVLRLRGAHRGRLLGLAPSGRRVDLAVVAVARVDGGRLRHLRLWFDRLALLEQTSRQ
jgi:predicted ester cyclase